MDCKKVGLLIKQKRLEKNMTQQELADRLHITDRAISNWERGLRAPDISLLQELSNILGLGISDILSGCQRRPAHRYGEGPVQEARRYLKKTHTAPALKGAA